MSSRKQPSAIGLSMLDLISNSLAAVIILFIIISSLRIPSIPPERYEGTLLIRYELKSTKAKTDIWIEPPIPEGGIEESKQTRFWRSEMGQLNSLDWVFGQYSECWENIREPWKYETKGITCIMTYSPIDSLNVHYVVIRDPVKGEWKTGLLFQDHNDYEEKTFPGIEKAFDSEIKAWFVEKDNKVEKIERGNKKPVRFSTHSLGLKFGREDIKVNQ